MRRQSWFAIATGQLLCSRLCTHDEGNKTGIIDRSQNKRLVFYAPTHLCIVSWKCIQDTLNTINCFGSFSGQCLRHLLVYVLPCLCTDRELLQKVSRKCKPELQSILLFNKQIANVGMAGIPHTLNTHPLGSSIGWGHTSKQPR